jgi:hypothetical protein
MNESILIFPSLWQMFGPIFKELWPYLVGALVLPVLLRALEAFIKTKTFKYFLRKNRVEFITLIYTVTGYIISYAFLDKPGVSFLLSIIVTFGAVLILIYSKTREHDFHFLPLRKNDEKEDWMGNGFFQRERMQNAFAITESESGFIFSKCLTWSDYTFDFDFKILNVSLGVILRATNLSNLVMLQIFNNRVKAHIRVNGFWKTWESEDSNMAFVKKLSFEKWYRGQFQCDKGSIRIRIYNMKNFILFDRVWKIPSGKIFFPLEIDKKSALPTEVAAPSIPFSINLEYGTIGFRNDGREKALIENVLVEKLQGANSID